MRLGGGGNLRYLWSMQLRFSTTKTTKVRFFASARELEAALVKRASLALVDPKAPVKTGRLPVRALPEGEACKRWEVLGQNLAWLSETKAERGACLAGIGGGATLDLAGFTASLYRRGMPLVFVPTTLLGMVDATLGGKTAVDAEEGGALRKNFAGTFYPADEVWVHTGYLASLPPRERISGAGECYKTLWIAGKAKGDEALREFVKGTAPSAGLEKLVRLCLKEKLRVVEQDPLDTKRVREILNFGHTVGHALESLTGGRLSHGECVLWGMWAEAGLLGKRGQEMRALAERTCAGLGLERPAEFGLAAAKWEAALGADKKAAGGKIAMTVLEAPGRARKLSLTAREVAAGL